MEKRILGRSGFEVSPMGIGCWAIGGQFFLDGKNDGYGDTDDNESIKAVQTALDLGVNFIDTADCYGIGHSEELLGVALKGRRDGVILATKFGFVGNEATKTIQGVCYDPAYIERALDASLKRLQTDHIDLYQFHVGDVSISEADSVIGTLERLVAKGKIRSFGWSTNALAPARLMAAHAGCTAIQHDYNILQDSDRDASILRAAEPREHQQKSSGDGFFERQIQSRHPNPEKRRSRSRPLLGRKYFQGRPPCRGCSAKAGRRPRDPYLRRSHACSGLSLLDLGEKRLDAPDPRLQKRRAG